MKPPMRNACQPLFTFKPYKSAAIPALTPPPTLYMAWLVLINRRWYLVSRIPTMVLTATPFKKLMNPRKNNAAPNNHLLGAKISMVMSPTYNILPLPSHEPTLTLENTYPEIKTPHNDPSGPKSNSNPNSPSDTSNLLMMNGKAAAQIPIIRLEVENKNPKEATSFIWKKLRVFFNNMVTFEPRN